MAGIRIDRRGQKRGKRWCPMMKEWCKDGWTKSMGTEDGMPIPGACAAWEPVSVYIAKDNRTMDIFDCTLMAWPVDLLGEVSKEAFQAGASSDKVANEVAKFHATSIALTPPEDRARLMAANPRLMPSLPPVPVADKPLLDNGGKDAS